MLYKTYYKQNVFAKIQPSDKEIRELTKKRREKLL